tara:strand:+ start:23 stop:238 length:216 start_codon:yes stop_codon:yes gene_type:complete
VWHLLRSAQLALHVLQISHILNISKFPTPQNNVPENVELTSILVDDTSDKLVATASLKVSLDEDSSDELLN